MAWTLTAGIVGILVGAAASLVYLRREPTVRDAAGSLLAFVGVYGLPSGLAAAGGRLIDEGIPASQLVVGYVAGVSVPLLPVLAWRLWRQVEKTMYRDHVSREIARKVVALRSYGYSTAQVAQMLDLDVEMVKRIFTDEIRRLLKEE